MEPDLAALRQRPTPLSSKKPAVLYVEADSSHANVAPSQCLRRSPLLQCPSSPVPSDNDSCTTPHVNTVTPLRHLYLHRSSPLPSYNVTPPLAITSKHRQRQPRHYSTTNASAPVTFKLRRLHQRLSTTRPCSFDRDTVQQSDPRHLVNSSSSISISSSSRAHSDPAEPSTTAPDHRCPVRRPTTTTSSTATAQQCPDNDAGVPSSTPTYKDRRRGEFQERFSGRPYFVPQCKIAEFLSC